MRQQRNLKNKTNKLGWYSTRRFRDAQLTMNCMDELNVIADYRRSQEAELLLGNDG